MEALQEAAEAYLVSATPHVALARFFFHCIILHAPWQLITPLTVDLLPTKLDMALLLLYAFHDSLLCVQVGLFEDSNLCAIHAKRVTIM